MATNKRLIKSNDEAAGDASFNTVLWTGNATARSITGVGFQPDFVWIKARSQNAYAHRLTDSVRGATKLLFSSSTSAEVTDVNTLTSFNADGFTLGNEQYVNGSGIDFVAWCWKAGGAAVTNTDGTITSQVSANPGAGFSIVKQLSNGTNQTYGHGLGVAPSVIISKNLDVSGPWGVYHKDLGTGKWLYLNETDTVGTSVNVYPIVNDTVFSGGSGGWNAFNNYYINYCFAEVAGFSKIGSYSGTNSAGNKQTTGFEPAFILIKETTRALDWYILDNKRNSTNPRTTILVPNDSIAEVTFPQGLNFESDGFSFTGAYFNDSGSTFIYMAFANQF